MIINGNFKLACSTSVQSLSSSLIILEPLPNLEIQKDLIVDMDPFWEAIYKIEPYLYPGEEVFEKGYRIEEKQMEKAFQVMSCIMCGCCYSACPVASRDEKYIGPAALAKLNRFINDPRDKRPFSIWSKINSEGGVWGCDMIFKCNEVCPKNIRPADSIVALRRKLIFEKIKHFFKLKR